MAAQHGKDYSHIVFSDLHNDGRKLWDACQSYINHHGIFGGNKPAPFSLIFTPPSVVPSAGSQKLELCGKCVREKWQWREKELICVMM